MLIYESIEFHGEAATEAAIARDVPSELLYVPIAASMHSDNLEWAQGVCIRLATHSDFNVRGNAVLGFGHLARRFRRLDREQIEPLVLEALSDPDAYVRAHAEGTVSELKHELGWPVAH